MPADTSGLREISLACDLLFYALQGVRREGGPPASTHSLEVTHLLADKKLDKETIITGIIHDLVEDTKLFPQKMSDRIITIDHVRNLFGEAVVGMTENLIKVKGRRNQDLTPQTHFKMFQALFTDPRAIFVKLADRLHNMRTIDGLIDRGKRRRKATETLKVYVPLAKRLGLFDWGEELAHHSFRTLYPKTYQLVSGEFERWKAGTDHKEIRKLIEQGLAVGPKKRKVKMTYPSLYRLYRLREDNLNRIIPSDFVPVVSIILNPARNEAMRRSETMLRASLEGLVKDACSSLSKSGNFPEGYQKMLQDQFDEGVQNVELPFEMEGQKMDIRFVTPADRDAWRASLIHYYQEKSPLHRAAVAKIEEMKRNLKRVGRSKAGVEEFVRNLEANLVTVKINGEEYTFPAGAKFMDVVIEIYGPEKLEKFAQASVFREGVHLDIVLSKADSAIAEGDVISFREEEIAGLMPLTPNSLDLVVTPYAKREIGRKLIEVIERERERPYRSRTITRMAKKRGIERLEDLFAMVARERGLEQNKLMVRIDTASKIIAKEMSQISDSDPFSKRGIKYSSVNRLLILMGIDYLNFETEENRRLLRNVVDKLIERQSSLYSVYINVLDVEGALDVITSILANRRISIWGIGNRPDQNEARRQEIALLLSLQGVAEFQKIIPKLERVRIRSGSGKRRLVYSVDIHPSVFEAQEEEARGD